MSGGSLAAGLNGRAISRWRLPEIPIVGGVLIAWVVLAAVSVAPDASVYDEHPHIVSGYSHFESGRFTGGLDNPPLFQLFLVLPAWLARVPYEPYVDSQLMWFRFPAIVIGALTGLLVYVFSRSLHGRRGAALSLFFFFFCATSMGLARYAVLDFGAAFFLLLALLAADRYVVRPSGPRLVLAGAACGAAICVKYTLLPLWGLIPWMILIAPRDPRVGFARGRLLPAVGIVAVALVVADASFLFQGVLELKPLGGPLRQGLSPSVVRLLELLSPLLPSELQSGIAAKLCQASTGRPTFLLGEWRSGRVWYYFPVALWLKTSVALHLALALLFVQLVRRDARFGFRHAVLWMPASVLFVSLWWSGINIGVRHVVFVLPVLFVLLGALSLPYEATGTRGRVSKAGIAALAIAYASGHAAAYPHYLEFFNAAVGGSPNGYTQLIDSNLDWGQDDELPARFARQRGIASLRINESPFEARVGWLALSANTYQGLYHLAPGLDGRTAWSWAKKLTPRARLAHTWFIYEITEDELHAYARAHPEDADAWVDLGQVLLERRDFAGARSALERAEKISGSRRAEPALRLAQLALAAGDARAALDPIESAFRRAPRARDVQLWRWIARADARLQSLRSREGGEDDQAAWTAAFVEKLRATCELGDPAACRRIAETLRGSENVDSAAYWFGIGHGHLNLGELDQARSAFERAIELEPANQTYQQASAVAARLAAARSSSHAEDHLELGLALERMGHRRSAMDQYLAARALAPGAPAPLWAMGNLQIARRLGRAPFPWP